MTYERAYESTNAARYVSASGCDAASTCTPLNDLLSLAIARDSRATSLSCSIMSLGEKETHRIVLAAQLQRRHDVLSRGIVLRFDVGLRSDDARHERPSHLRWPICTEGCRAKRMQDEAGSLPAEGDE